MNILVNASNLKKGGGVQVADSICCLLEGFTQYHFVVVLSSFMQATRYKMKNVKNVEVVIHDVNNNVSTLLFGRDSFLDGLVKNRRIDGVLTVFGPSRWNPKCVHLSGFARPHLVMPSSPYFRQLSYLARLKEKLQNILLKYMFARSTHFFFTENSYISKLVGQLFRKSSVYTITNYYNQVYDHPENWVKKVLPPFEGITLLTGTAYYTHKNLPISIEIARVLRKKYPNFIFRFVFTVEEAQFPVIEEELQEHFVFVGRVDIVECPSLYEQSDIMFLPTLLECFSATYPEAMKMECPIVTTDLEFAKGLCGNAARYYSPLSAVEAAEAIYQVGTNVSLRKQLIDAGKQQLKTYDTYDERVSKLVRLLEHLIDVNKSN